MTNKTSDRAYSFALVTRLQFSETPFLNEFLSYYVHLGIDRFYLVNTEPENHSLIAAEISPDFINKVELINKRDRIGLNGCQNIALQRINETFLLHVDMDEFLYLNGMTLKEFVAAEELVDANNEVTACDFRWINSPLHNQLYAPSIKSILDQNYFFASASVKSMAGTQDISKIKPHKFIFNKEQEMRRYIPHRSKCFIFHISARGIFDIVNKVQFGQYTNVKNTHDPARELDELIFDTSSSRLPNRFKLLAFLSRFDEHLVSPSYVFPDLEFTTNTQLLKDITINSLEDLLGKQVNEQALEKTVLDKLRRYPIPTELVQKYAQRRTGLINVLRALVDRDASTTQ